MQESKGERTSEIAAAVQAGEADILSLWAAVERFAWQQSLRWARAMEGRAGVEESDLLQVAFIALMDTLPTWDADKGENFLRCTASSSGRRLQRLAGRELSGRDVTPSTLFAGRWTSR